MSASKLIHYFSSHLAAFAFWAFSQSDNITLNPLNKRTNQSLSDGIAATAHTTLDIVQLISNTRTAFV